MKYNEIEYVPVSNEDLYVKYFSSMSCMVQQTIKAKFQGQIDDDRVFDLAHTVYARMLSEDLLLRFDPSRISSFRSFLYNIVVNCCYSEMRRMRREGIELDVTDSGPSDDESESVSSAHLAAIEATQHVKTERLEVIKAMQDYCNRCARLNRHKRDRSLKTVLAATADGDSLESIAAQIGVTVGTARNYIRHLAHGALAEQTGNAAQYASESTYRPDARRELSAKDIASLVRSAGEKQIVFCDSDGTRSYPQFVANRRGWHFVTFGDSPDVTLNRLTSNTRGFKLHAIGGERVLKIRRSIETDSEVILFESAKDSD